MSYSQRTPIFFIANFIVFYLASLWGRPFIVFGNALSSPIQAAVTLTLVVTIVSSLVEPVAKRFKFAPSMSGWFFIYWLVNTLAIYGSVRIPAVSKIVGVGIVRFWVAIVIGLVINLAQFLAWKSVSKK